MEAYFYWTGVIVNVGATVIVILVGLWLFLEWYVKIANVKKLFLEWQWERLTKKRRNDETLDQKGTALDR